MLQDCIDPAGALLAPGLHLGFILLITTLGQAVQTATFQSTSLCAYPSYALTACAGGYCGETVSRALLKASRQS